MTDMSLRGASRTRIPTVVQVLGETYGMCSANDSLEFDRTDYTRRNLLRIVGAIGK